MPARPVPPRRRPGCVGVFCRIVLVVMLAALILGGYQLGRRLDALGAPDRGGVPAFTDTFNAYDPAQEKIAAFSSDLQGGRPATLRLTVDDVNALLSRSELSLQHGIFFFFSFSGRQARLQTSIPSEAVTFGLERVRFFNLDFQFTPSIDTRAKSLVLKPETFFVRGEPFLGGDAQGQVATRFVLAELATAVNTEMRKSPTGRRILENATMVGVQDGQFVIQTQ